jgi:hypothetical protein
LVLAKYRYEDQWKRIEDPDINLYSYAYVIFDEVARNVGWRKDKLFDKCCLKNSSMIYFIYCKNLRKYSNVSPPNTTTTTIIIIKKTLHLHAEN